jgi:hypothetical protein
MAIVLMAARANSKVRPCTVLTTLLATWFCTWQTCIENGEPKKYMEYE